MARRDTPYGARVKLQSRNEPFGIWVNPSYERVTTISCKIVYNPDGTWVSDDCLRSPLPCHRGTVSIWDHWRDNNGSHWYKVTTNQAGVFMLAYELWRIDRKGFVLEGVWNCGSIPANIDPGDPTYTIYYRHAVAAKYPPSVSEPPSLKRDGKTTV
jgi:hypothetical protein